MQPNNNLVFYLAGDENEIGDASQNQVSASSLEKINDLQPEASELDVATMSPTAVAEAIRNIRASSSWRVTAPLRKLRRPR